MTRNIQVASSAIPTRLRGWWFKGGDDAGVSGFLQLAISRAAHWHPASGVAVVIRVVPHD